MKLTVDSDFLRIDPQSPKKGAVLMLHGYGQSRFEVLPLAAKLALAGYEIAIPDLPGHGQNSELLTPQTLIDFTLSAFNQLGGPTISVVGFSLGARLAMQLAAQRCIAISPPLDNSFEPQHRAQILETLNSRRVREVGPMIGLRSSIDLLNQLPILGEYLTLIRAQKDLSSVQAGIKEWESQARCCHTIAYSTHATILNAPDLIDRVLEGLQ